MRKFKFTFVLFWAVFLSVSSISFAQYRNVKGKINKVLRDENLKDAFTGIEVFDLTRNRRVYSYNSGKLFTPASNEKILTTAAALYFLPQDYRFSTYLRITGPVVNSVLYGDIVIKGTDDPLFKTGDLTALADSISGKGIKLVKGNLIGDVGWSDSLYFGSGWMWDDAYYGFMPFLTPLILNKSRLEIEVKPANPNQIASVNFLDSLADFSLHNFILTIKDDSSNYDIERNYLGHKNVFWANGFISANAEPDTATLNIVNPEKYFLQSFKEICSERGIKITGDIELKRNVPYVSELFTVTHSLDSVIVETNKESENIDAETLLRALAAEYYGEPATAANGVKMIDSLITLTGNSPKDFIIADGSGLSRYNLISPELVIDIFRFLQKKTPEKFNRLIESLPVAGVDGTLKKRMRKGRAFKNLRAKTGTMTAVSALSGIVTNRRGRKLLFSIMMQNYSAKTSEIRKLQDKICEILASSR